MLIFLSTIPAYIWIMLFLMLNATVTLILWGVELKPFFNSVMTMSLPKERPTSNNLIVTIKNIFLQIGDIISFTIKVIGRFTKSIPFLIDFSITMFLMAALGLSGNMGASLSLFMSNIISIILISVIKGMSNDYAK